MEADWPKGYLHGDNQYLGVHGHRRPAAALYGGGKATAADSATSPYQTRELAASTAWLARKTEVVAAWAAALAD